MLVEMGNRISKRRKELKMTQEQVAEQIDLSIQSISCIELGKKAIRPENLLKLCHALDVTADYVLTGKKSLLRTDEVFKKLSSLDDDDFKMVESFIERLLQKK